MNIEWRKQVFDESGARRVKPCPGLRDGYRLIPCTEGEGGKPAMVPVAYENESWGFTSGYCDECCEARNMGWKGALDRDPWDPPEECDSEYDTDADWHNRHDEMRSGFWRG